VNIYTNSRGQPTTVSSAGWGLCEVIKLLTVKNDLRNMNTRLRPGLILWYDLSEERGT